MLARLVHVGRVGEGARPGGIGDLCRATPHRRAATIGGGLKDRLVGDGMGDGLAHLRSLETARTSC